MRILLIANYLADTQRSMQSYAAVLQDGFTRAGHEVKLIRPSLRAGRLKLGKAAKWSGYIDKLVLFPGELQGAIEWGEMVHICDHSNAVYVKYIEARPHVVTCHDLLAIRSALGDFPEHRTRWSGRQLQRMILEGLSRARAIVCVSEATRADLTRLLPQGNQTITRIYNGLNYPYKPMGREEAAARLRRAGMDPDGAFILHVGGNQWYKNRTGVLTIFAATRRLVPDLRLVMAGKPWTREMRQLVQLHGLEGSVIEMADVAEEDLRALYSRAEALLFPSLEEGFGWPVAEAQACGCPVVTSRRAPMTEVGGSTATYIDPLNPEAAAVAVALVVESGERHPAPTRFSTSAMIDAYLEVYERLLGASDRRLMCA